MRHDPSHVSPSGPGSTPLAPPLPLGRRLARAAGLSFAWTIGALPTLLGVVRCPSARYLGIPCPGCGMQRAIHSALLGDVRASIAMNPLAIPIALSAFALAACTVWITLERGSPLGLLDRRIARAAVFAFVAFEILSVVVWALRFAGLFGGPVPV